MLHRLWKIADFTKQSNEIADYTKKAKILQLFKISRFGCSFCKIDLSKQADTFCRTSEKMNICGLSWAYLLFKFFLNKNEISQRYFK